MRKLGAHLLPAAIAIACSGQPKPTAVTKTPPALTDERFDNLTALALGRPLDPAIRAATLEQLRSGALTLDKYIDELVRDPALSREVVPRVVLGWLDFGPFSFVLFPLDKQVVDGVTIYRSRGRAGGLLPTPPCSPEQAVDVAPWWDLTTTVKVCPVDYQPTSLRSEHGICTGSQAMADPKMVCGCGPNLINCTPDPGAVMRSFHHETVRTIAYIVENDRPFKEALTTNYSFRDRITAYQYERDHVYQGRIKQVPDLSSWPEDGKWAPREEAWPGAHAGILTNRQLLWMSDGPRDRMRQTFERFWCKVPTSFGVDIETFRTLVHGEADLRNRGARWRELAAQPGCTSCHARMDYGMQFFLGYPSSATAVTAVPEDARPKDRGAFFGDDIDDKRGEATLTPRQFAEFLVAQPEFDACMVDHVENHVLGTATPEERAELRAVFAAKGTMRALFATALKQYAMRPTVSERAPVMAPPPGRPARDGAVVLSDELVRRIDDACGHCHSAAGDKLGFLSKLERSKQLDRDQLILMGNVVAAGLMPKNEPMTPGDRRQLLTAIVDAVAPDPAWAREALAHWSGDEFQPSRVHHISALRARMLSKIPGAKDDTNTRSLVDHTFERRLLVMTPAYLMEMAKLSAKMCAHVEARDRYQCYLDATKPDIARSD